MNGAPPAATSARSAAATLLSGSERGDQRQRQLWLDCTSLSQWQLTHLTGIQRTVVGIANGWEALGVEVGLFVFEAEHQRFRAIERNDLPAAVRHYLGDQSAVPPPPPAPNAGEVTVKPVPGEWRQALGRLNLSRWRLQQAVGRWLQSRWRRGAESNQGDASGATPAKGLDLLAMIEPGDWIFSLGSECYEQPHRLVAYDQFSQRGAILIRMIYDMIPVAQPHWVYEATTKAFETAALQLISQSHQLLTISEHSKAEIINFAARHQLDPPPISVIRLGDQLETSDCNSSDLAEPHNKPTRPFLLCLGTLEPRKNLRLLQDTWRRLLKESGFTCPDLVCIGHHDSRSAQIIHEIHCEPGVNERIQLLDQIDDRQLAWYFHHCLATLFPSLAEGWGLPVAESLARGRLCLAANSSSIPEISDLTLLFDPLDPVALAALIKRTVSDPTWRQQEEERIRQGYTITTWAQTARQTLAAVAMHEEARATCG